MLSKLNLFCFEGSCDNLKGQWTLKTMFIVNCRCFTRVKCFLKKVKCPVMDKQEKMTCSVVKPATQFLIPRNVHHNAVKIVVRKNPSDPTSRQKREVCLSSFGSGMDINFASSSSFFISSSSWIVGNRNDRFPFPRKNK